MKRLSTLSRKVSARRATVQKINAILDTEAEHDTVIIHSETPLDDHLDQCVKDYTFISSYLRLISNFFASNGQGVPLDLVSDGKQLIFLSDGKFAQVSLVNGKLPENAILERLERTDVLKYGNSQFIADKIDTALDELNNKVQDDDIKRNKDKYYLRGLASKLEPKDD